MNFALLFWLAVPLALAQAPRADTTKADPARIETILGPGDVVRVTVFQNPDSAVESRISESGQINFPLIGAVTVGGLTSRPRKADRDMLREGGFVLRPQVTIQVVRTLSSQASVLGQVNRPGRYPIEMTSSKVSEMVAAAGGVIPGGADIVTLVGTRNGEPVKLDIDLPSILSRAAPSSTSRWRTVTSSTSTGAHHLYLWRSAAPGQKRLERA